MQAQAMELSEEVEDAVATPPPPILPPKLLYIIEPPEFLRHREEYSLWIFPPNNRYNKQQNFYF